MPVEEVRVGLRRPTTAKELPEGRAFQNEGVSL